MNIHLPHREQMSAYYQSYQHYLHENDLLMALKNATEELDTVLQNIPAAKEAFRYAPEKWMLKEVIGHLCDTERILCYRALRFARKDKTPLAGFEENDYVKNSNFHARSMQSIGIELMLVREASQAFYHSLDEADYDSMGIANTLNLSPRHMLYFTIVHQRHHFKIIRERYLV
jgi:uncharacterized damage-inducible protein DinB